MHIPILTELFCNILCRLLRFYAALFYRDYIEILCYWIYADFTKILCSFILQRLYGDFVSLDLQTFFLLPFLQRIYGDFTEISTYAIKSQ